MNLDPTLYALIEDIKAIKRWCSSNSGEPVPSQAVDYLAFNKDALLFFINQLAPISISDRTRIHSQDHVLDESVITDDLSFARTAVEEAHQSASGDKLSQVTDDDVNMILRAIDYVRHLDCAQYPQKLRYSPIRLPK